jgi:Uma2 family endonuclease
MGAGSERTSRQVVQTRRMTVEEFEDFVDLPENADRLFEYIGGEPVESPSNPFVSKIAARISYWITHYLMENDIGHIIGEAGGYMVAGERYAPDVAYISKARQPELPQQGYNPIPPDLAVEVLSPSNEPDEIQIKINNYLLAGTVVWLVNPARKRVTVFMSGRAAQPINVQGTLDGGDILPSFTLAVKEIFPD